MRAKDKILIVDDNEELCQNLADILELKGYEISKAYDGYHAIESMKSKKFSVVIMDIKMPGINGLDTLKILKQINPKISIILITAFADDIFYKESKKNNDLKIVQKPIDMDNFLFLIEDILAQKNGALPQSAPLKPNGEK